MRLASSITALATLISTTSASLALQPRTTTVPSVDIASYQYPKCSTTSAHGSKHAPTHQLVPYDVCTVIGKTLSFRVFVSTPCGDGYVPFLLIYQFPNCTGEGVEEIYYTPITDKCIEDDKVGRGALFQCTDS